MIYVIDANNLAGKLDLLSENNFNEQLIELIKNYFKGKNKIFLIFDSLEQMGDRFEEDNITVIYTPRDKFYKNGADDKIIEVLDLFLTKKFESDLNKVNFRKTDGAILVTDDIDLINRAKSRFNEETSFKDGKYMKLQIQSASKLANYMQDAGDHLIKIDDDKQRLSQDDEEDINNELMNLWNK